MTANLPALLEIKFACPHCGQHIACDSAYCNTRIDCPSCRQEMAVPRLAAFGSESAGDLSLAPQPAASPSVTEFADPPPLDLWTEEEWDRRVAEDRLRRAPRLPGSIALQSWFWLFFLGPLFLFFAGGGMEFRWLSITALQVICLFCAVISGFLLAKAVSNNLGNFIIAGVLFSALVAAADLFVCFFGGCAMACAQAAGGG